MTLAEISFSIFMIFVSYPSIFFYLILVQKELRPPIDRIEKYVENLRSLTDGYFAWLSLQKDGRYSSWLQT